MRNNCLFQELSKFKYAKSDRYEILIFVDSPTTFIDIFGQTNRLWGDVQRLRAKFKKQIKYDFFYRVLPEKIITVKYPIHDKITILNLSIDEICFLARYLCSTYEANRYYISKIDHSNPYYKLFQLIGNIRQQRKKSIDH